MVNQTLTNQVENLYRLETYIPAHVTAGMWDTIATETATTTIPEAVTAVNTYVTGDGLHKIQEAIAAEVEKYFEKFVDVRDIAYGDRVPTRLFNSDQNVDEALDRIIHQSARFFAIPNPEGKVKIVVRNGGDLEVLPCDLHLVSHEDEITDEEFFDLLNIEGIIE